MTPQEFKAFCINQHDVVCNQKYDQILPYSQHLKYVEAEFYIWKHILGTVKAKELCFMGCYGHDLIEDARLTYNDIKDLVGVEVAEIIYACTEEKGRNRLARHSKPYYLDLAQNNLAVFVKLCDIIANVTYSLLTNSSMYQKHKEEHENTKLYLVTDELNMEFKPMIEHLDKLFAIR